MRELVTEIHFAELDRFKRLHYRIIELLSELLNELLLPTKQMIKNLIAVEDAYINVNHPDFILARDATLNIFKRNNDPPSSDNVFAKPDKNHNIYENGGEEEVKAVISDEEDGDLVNDDFNNPNGEGFFSKIWGTNKNEQQKPQSGNPYHAHYDIDQMKSRRERDIHLPMVPNKMRMDDDPGSREILETQILKNCVTSYFNIVRKHIIDLVPKTVMAFLVNKAKDTAQ